MRGLEPSNEMVLTLPFGNKVYPTSPGGNVVICTQRPPLPTDLDVVCDHLHGTAAVLQEKSARRTKWMKLK